MTRVAVTYARRNKEFVGPVVRDLAKHGFEMWIDEHIISGTKWWDEVLNSLESADVVIMFVSRHYLASPVCKSELQFVLEKKKPLIPIYLDDSSLSSVREIHSIPFGKHTAVDIAKKLQHQIPKLLELVSKSPSEYNASVDKKDYLFPIDREKDYRFHVTVAEIMHKIQPLNQIRDDRTLKEAHDIFVTRTPDLPCAVVVDNNNRFTGWITIGMVMDCFVPHKIYIDKYVKTKIITNEEYEALSTERQDQYLVGKHAIKPLGDLIQLKSDSDVKDAFLKLIERHNVQPRIVRIRAFPVVDGLSAVGVVGFWHLISYFSRYEMLPNVMLREIMLKTMERSSVFIPIHPEMKLKDVERIVNEQGWSHIIITTKEGSFVGVMRVEELRRTIDSEFPELYELSVEEWLLPFNHDAHRGVIDVSGDTRLNEVIHLFENPSANVIPIIEEGKLEGIVTHVQVLEAIDAYLDDYHKRDDV